MNQARRVARRVRSRLSKLVLLVILGVISTGVLFSVDAVLAGRPLLAISALLAAAMTVLIVWKLHSISLDLRDLRRRPVSVIAPPAPAAAPPATPTPAGRSLEEKLRDIGVFYPQRASGTMAGRQAAAVSTDPEAPYRLYAATHQAGGRGAGGRVFAVAGSDRLVALLEQHGTVHRLHPSMSMAEMAKHDPDVLVVEEDAFHDGVWRGAVDPHGGKLLQELRVAMSTMRKLHRPIYVLTATGIPGQAAPFLRADTIVVDDATTEGTPLDDAPPSLLLSMALHRLKTPGRTS